MQKFPLNFYHDLGKRRFDVDFVVPIEHLSSLEEFFQKKLKTSHEFSRKNVSRSQNPEEVLQYKEIALEEIKNASNEFMLGIEMYNTILDYYNDSGENSIIRVGKII